MLAMKINFDKLDYFEKYVDPQSGVVSYVLNDSSLPLVKNFYFCNTGVCESQKCMWLCCSYPPGLARHLAVVSLDDDNPFVRNFPAAQFSEESPWVCPEDGSVYYCEREYIYRITMEGEISLIATIPDEIINNRRIFVTATHLTRSADKKHFILDMQIGNEVMLLLFDIEKRDFKLLSRFKNYFDHAQFSYTDPKQFIIDEDWEYDAVTGQRYEYHHRIWIMDTDQTYFQAIDGDKWFYRDSLMTHDFYSRDGYICWVDADKGAFEYNPETKEIINLWKRPMCHAHCSTHREYWCADYSPYLWNKQPCKVLFFNRELNKETEIFSAMPEPDDKDRKYHLDPHPAFTAEGDYITAFTTVTGKPSVSITPVAQLI